ncbi:MAG: DUF4249 family protein [Bacteroidetes bacterium]|jgi:hypothetical protein|nr:DUF4249 family protein [Bacteroidota bacterium]MBT3751741.1 DUF4249 family protein [Bacteroidota bacterium]MBT4408794.1 DUF4249 family protein [Bacteroidota bacterium]MBT7093860.1 DUF4249 family protein [Bacteroidota bacterium]MBT7464724.1 DUF4249 family protein [Bacteroidota bacterium]
MCKNRQIIFILFILGALLACENEVNLLEPGDPIPVVYGIICPDDTLHQIRLLKTFDGSKIPEVEASVSDSLYYDQAEVYLELRSTQGLVLERLELSKTLINNRREGIFATTPNIIYQGHPFDIRQGSLNGELVYHLTIYLPDFDQSVFATTAIPPTQEPSSNMISGEEINVFDYFVHPKYIFSAPVKTFATELIIEFLFEELINAEWHQISFQNKRYYRPYSGHVSTDSIKFSPIWLYKQIANNIKENEAVSNRRFSSIIIRKRLVSPDYSHYLSSLEYSPDLYTHIFSNITNGKGLFAAYSKSEITGITFSEQMLDSLSFGQYTKHLKFKRW